jgi:hypothetical protein
MKLPKIVEILRERLEIRRRVVGMVEEEYKKRKQYQALVGQELNYPIIQDLINSVARGYQVSITVALAGGTSFKIERTAEQSVEDLARQYREFF